MATNNVPTVNVNLDAVSRKVAEDDKAISRRKEAAAQQVIPDSVEIATSSNASIASHAEGQAPSAKQNSSQSSHANLLGAREKLEKKFEEAGLKASPKDIEGEKIEKYAFDVKERLESKISKLKESDASKEDISHLSTMRDEITQALDDYHKVHFEASLGASGEALSGETLMKSNSPDQSVAASSQESALWEQVEGKLGVKFSGAAGMERDPEKLQVVASKHFEEATASLQDEMKSLKTKQLETEGRLKNAKPEKKKPILEELKTILTEQDRLIQKAKGIQQDVSQVAALSDNILALRTQKDLGVSSQTQTIQEESVSTFQRKAQRQTSNPTQPKTSDKATTQQSALSIQSAGDSSSSLTSASDPTSSTTPLTSSTPDYSGTSLMISSAANNLQSESKKTDAQIKKLLQAALSGNWEAIKSALILLDKRASTVVMGIGAQTIKAMQFYEKQTAALSSSLGKLKGKEPDYNARLAKINSDMNLYSMNRQAISNFLRDAMTMREEIANTTHGLLQRDAQIVGTTSR